MVSSKTYLKVLNAAFFVLSLGMFTAGLTAKISVDANYSLFRDHIDSWFTFIIIFGVILFSSVVVSLIGLYRKVYILLTTHIINMVVLVVIELSASVGFFATKNSTLQHAMHSLLFAESIYTSNNAASTTWNHIQRDLNCCGVYRFDEWFKYLGNSSVPDSCCIVYKTNCGKYAVGTDNIYQTVCATAFSVKTTHVEVAFVLLFMFLIIFQLSSISLTRRYQRILK